MNPRALTNGMGFAFARDRDGVVYEDFGYIPDRNQKPRNRDFNSLRDQRSRKVIPDPIYERGTLPKGSTGHGAAQALYEARFVDGALFTSAGYEGTNIGVTASISEPFLKVVPAKGRRR